MKKDWFFAIDNSPSETFSDAEAEIFRTAGAGPEKFKGLAREIIQNSIDAKRDDVVDPLVVKFEFLTVDKTEIPGMDTLEKHIKGTVDYCELKGKKNNALNISKKQLQLLEKAKLNVLKISDYNTKGVTGSKNLDGNNCKWKGLVYNEGDSIKDSTSALGSFGLGKNASFAMSLLRTVFYVTKDIDKNYAMEGVAKLYTSYTGTNKFVPKGFFCKEENGDTLPFYEEDMSDFSNIFTRTETGTDILIIEPDIELYKNRIEWYLIESIICNFFIAFKEGTLEVFVNNTEISQATLETVFSNLLDYYDNNDIQKSELLISVSQYLDTLDKGDDLSGNLLGYGDILLKLHKTRETKGKKVAIFREHGMLIKEYSVNGASQKFSGVLIVKGKEGIDFLKAIEDPSHTDFDPTRQTEDLKLTDQEKQDKLKLFYNWIINNAKKYTKIKTDDKISLSGMEDYIQMPDDDVNINNITELNVKKININKPAKKKPRVSKKEPVSPNPNGEPIVQPPVDPVPHPHPPVPNPDPRDPNPVEPDPKGKKRGIIKSFIASYEIAPVVKFIDNSATLIFKITETNKDFRVKIYAIDEQGRENNIMPKISSAKDLTTGEQLAIKGYTIYDVKCNGVVKLNIEFESILMSKVKAIVYWEEEVIQ